MPTFHYKCVLLITYNPDNISKKYLQVCGVSSFGSAYPYQARSWIFGSVHQISVLSDKFTVFKAKGHCEINQSHVQEH